MKSTLYENVFTFMVICRWFLRRMRNVFNKLCRENQNTHFMFSNFFPKFVPFEKIARIWWSQRGRRWQYGGALHAAWVRLHARKHKPAPVHPYADACTHPRARAHVIIAFPRQQWFHEHVSCYVIRTLPILFILVKCIASDRTVVNDALGHGTGM